MQDTSAEIETEQRPGSFLDTITRPSDAIPEQGEQEESDQTGKKRY